MTQSRFSAAAGTHESHSFACGDFQRNVVDDLALTLRFITVIITEGHIFEPDMTGQRAGVYGIGILCLRSLLHDFTEAGEAGHTILQLLQQRSQAVYGLQEDIDIQQICGKVTGIDVAIEKEQAAGHQHHQIQHIGEELHAGMEDTHGFIGTRTGGYISFIGLVKLRRFIFAGGVGTGHANTGDCSLYVGIDLTGLNTGVTKRFGHHTASLDGKEDHQRQHQEHQNSQVNIDTAQHNKCAHQRNGGNQQVLGAVMCQLRYVLQIVDHTGHNDAGLVLIKEGKRQFLQFGEHIPAHISLHPHADDMAPVLNHKVQAGLCHIDQQHDHRPSDQQLKLFIGHIYIDDVTGNDGIKQITNRHQQTAEHIQCEQFAMRAIIRNKLFEHRIPFPSGKVAQTIFYYTRSHIN